MEKRNIPFSPPDITESEINEVAQALRSGWITTGPRVRKLEKELADYCHSPAFVCLNSATAAEELNLRMLALKEGDEVLVPAYTYTASASAAIHCGATVRFIDCQKDSLEMDYDLMEQAINEHTKAVVPVDLGGIICDYQRIYEALERKKDVFKPEGRIQQALGRVAVVADCAHSLGASRKGKMAGEIADFSSFSFHAVKNLTTAEGGGSCWRSLPGIDDGELYHLYQLYSLHGQSKDALAKSRADSWEYDIIGPWYKCNMTDVAAAMGLVQFQRYPQMLARRKQIIDRYDQTCDALGISHLIHHGPDFTSSMHLYLIWLPGFDHERRCQFISRMAEEGVSCNVHYKPLPMMSAYRALGWDIADFPNAYAHYENVVTLPLYSRLTDDDVSYVTEVLARVYEEMRQE
ncbi:MAG: DegT/DnrJ/EryC1/StrS family aminotransferase [Erysipelotrichaceae bacterium]|nr:DegT/DnrJ/EryC1/StrS family aminotransferase [Erysipelotrichaceae bacterium]